MFKNMNELFSISPINIILVIVVVIIGIFAIKIGITLNLAEWQKNRRGNFKDKLKAACPHTVLEIHGERMEVSSRFISPSGTIDYICQGCGLRTADRDLPEKLMHFYKDNPNRFIEDSKKFEKFYKRLYG